jgi:hypothetical protein
MAPTTPLNTHVTSTSVTSSMIEKPEEPESINTTTKEDTEDGWMSKLDQMAGVNAVCPIM